MGKCKRKRKCHSDRDTSVALYGEDCEQIKQKCITIADNTLPYTVSVNYKFFWTMPDYKETVNTVIKGCKSWNINQRIYWSINSGLRAELIIHKNYKIHTNHNSHWDICQKRNEKKKRDMKMDVKRMSVSKNDARKLFVTTTSDNHTCETHVTGLYTLICSYLLWLHML